jgi:hypothetical protein
MKNGTDIWSRRGEPVVYPGIVQTEETCVFVSLAGAMNSLAGTSITEAEMLARWKSESRPQATFGLALNYLRCQIASGGIETTRFHDSENPLADTGKIVRAIRNGAVLIVSLQAAIGDPGTLARADGWHMLSVFNLLGDVAQIWDTNDRTGFITVAELIDLLVGSSIAIPYPFLGTPDLYLVHHDQHEALLVSRDETQS